MLSEIEKIYKNITAEMIKIFLELCESCVLKQYSKNAGFVTNPIISNSFNKHIQADLVDMQGQECQEYRHFIVYQDHFTKLVQIRPLKRKTAKATTSAIFDFFMSLGAPDILQTDNGREFKNKLLESICCLMGVTMRHGKPRHSEANGGVERANQDIEKMLCTWKADNPHLSWVTGLQFVQMFKNKSLCAPIKMSPFEATFGCKMIQGLKDSTLPKEFFATTNTEDDLQVLGLVPQEDSLVSVFL